MNKRPLALFAFAILVGACNATPPAGAIALYDTSPSREDFFALPWPDDSRMKAGEGGVKHLDLAGFFNPGSAIGEYLKTFAAEPTTGFGTCSTLFFRFDAPIDPASLPQSAAESVTDGATAFVVDVTPGSPTLGKRHPVRTLLRESKGLYIGENSLAVTPESGFPLRERTRYAAVLTDGIRSRGGLPVGRDARFSMPAEALPLGVDAARVVVLTTFTTGDFTRTMKQLRDATYSQVKEPPAPKELTFVRTEQRKLFDQYEGIYEAPNFQEGDAPYSREGGRIHLGDDAKPKYVRMERMRFTVTVPRGTMPKDGWPVVLYAHGTGGDYVSFIDDRSAATAAVVRDENGGIVSQLAVIGIDQVLHGPRDPSGGDPAIAFYNFQNLLSARDSIKQGAADNFSLLRLVENFDVASAPNTNSPIKFDKDRIYFKGHSQGGTTGPLFLAFEPKVKAAVLSGAGAVLALWLISKVEPLNIPALVQAIVNEDVDETHPVLSLLQTWLESADPANYAKYFFREPPDGVPPKSIYQSLGIVDNYTPIPTIKAFALAMGVQPSGPQLVPMEDLDLAGLAWGTAPAADNVSNGKATGVLVQYQVPNRSSGKPAYDGHFVVFNHPDAVRQNNRFLATHAATGKALLVP